MTPLDPNVLYGALESARLVVDFIAERIIFPDAEGDPVGYSVTIKTEDETVCYFMFDDDPRPEGVHELWLLNLAMKEPYNKAHEIGLAIREIESLEEGGEKLTYMCA